MLRVNSAFLVCGLLLVATFTMKAEAKAYHWEGITQQQYVDNLLACNEDIKRYEWSRTLWPKANSEPKPSFDEVMSPEDLRLDLIDSLKKQAILEKHFNIRITAELLQHDLNRMANNSKDVASLKELYALLDNNPVTIAHCLSRPYLVETKLNNSFYWSSDLHRETASLAQVQLEHSRPNSSKNNVVSAQQQTVTYRIRAESEDFPNPEQQESVIELTAEGFKHELQKLQIGQLQESKTHFSVHQLVSLTPDSVTLSILLWKKQSLDSWLANTALLEDAVFPIETNLYLTKVREDHAADKMATLTDAWESNFKLPAERGGHTAVWTGTEMIVWGGSDGGLNLNTGGRYNPSTDSWTEINISGAPIARVGHTAVWTGNEMVIWGGQYLSNGMHYLQSGGRYDPSTDTWSPTSLSNAPSSRSSHTAIWDGNEMIVWGGYDGATYLDSGSRYDSSANSWLAVTSTNAPTGRKSHTAIWTGTEMIVWGGHNLVELRSGRRYNPALDQWQSMNEADAPEWRFGHTSIWTGEKMIVWGGISGPFRFNSGGIYDPSDDTWQSTSMTNAPIKRDAHTAIWTGDEMIIWGGYDPEPLNSGGRFNPGNNSWSTLSLVNAPSGRSGHTAIWTGGEMIVWGGAGNGTQNTGARYDPDGDTWQATYTTDAPDARSYHTAIWTGNEMIIWGGLRAVYLGDGSRYRPNLDTWSATTSINAPSARSDHSAIWTGTEMMVWGGRIEGDSATTYLSDGARYKPLNNSWQAISSSQAPEGRYRHTGIWTGSEMVIWGGKGSEYFKTGGRYDPATNAWLQTNLAGAPTGRRGHRAIWTGSQMVVWGGFRYDGAVVYFNDGGRYEPSGNSWQAINTTNAPAAREYHTAVWTGSEMIVWGGGPNGAGSALMTGGRYDPVNDTWSATSTINAPSKRKNHSAIWTGSEMIVWGGYYSDGYQDYFNTGGVYDPVNNIWQATTLLNSPRGRMDHSAVWTGAKMIIWGGNSGLPGNSTNTLGLYYPADDRLFKDGFE